MTPEDKALVDVFMKAQAEPEGRLFSENVLAGLKAVLATRSKESSVCLISEVESPVVGKMLWCATHGIYFGLTQSCPYGARSETERCPVCGGTIWACSRCVLSAPSITQHLPTDKKSTVTYGGFIPLKHESIQRLRGDLQELVAPDEIAIDDIDAICDMALASLNEPLPGCGHASQFAFTEDGGKTIVCLMCERGTRSAGVSMLDDDEQQFIAEAREIVARGDSSPEVHARDRINYRRSKLLLRLATVAHSAIKGRDEARLLWLGTLLKHCPHAELTYNDDDGDGPVGWRLLVESCSTLDLRAPTLEELIDLGMNAEADEDGNVIASPDRKGPANG